MIARVWQLSYEKVTLWLAKRRRLAQTLDFHPDKTISGSQLSRRIRTIGLLPFFIVFLLLVGILKAHFGLNDLAMMGMENTIRFTMLTCISVLMVAIAAHAIGQPQLARSPSKVLAGW